MKGMKAGWLGLAALMATSAGAQQGDYVVDAISLQAFREALAQAQPNPQPRLDSIQNWDQAQALLAGRLILDSDLKVLDATGRVLAQEAQFADWCDFDAYYPALDQVSFKCLQENDVLLDMATGQQQEDDPRQRRYAPGGQYRYGGYYNGQEPVSFIQKRVGEHWLTLREATDTMASGKLYFPSDFTWVSARRFVFQSTLDQGYFMGTIQ
ncbi:hypothetical protein [Gallaecimonas xiamenensis]|uniref:Uncharacterized protein n=1 Tax=Gallaecimonas xiamenensis 3-C-1 TaxID=745411 RepID=K2IDP8_9GAMM|nr:hypothetical protein [Gallaecimonas xiamenensis]EKE68101.1 hypothetical protein B3C1_17432 [Gallaecimonas xiamenensis 3-C-1]